ncbi:MAG: phage holin family protein [Acidobacteriota bacterium]
MRALGDAVFDLWGAEWQRLQQDLTRFAIQVAKLVGVGVAFLFVGFYLPFLLILAAVDGVREATGDLWSAALLVFLGVVLLLALIGLVVYLLIVRKMENPVESVTRRLDDHRGWWAAQALDEPRRLDDPPGEPT